MCDLRGRTFGDAVVVLDEMQNASPEQLKTSLTRAGDNCTMIVTLDPMQCDLPPGSPTAADDLERFEDQEGIAVFRFGIGDVVRSEVCKRVLRAYEA